MKKIYFTFLLLFGLPAFAENDSSPSFETFLEKWNKRTNSVQLRHREIIHNDSTNGKNVEIPVLEEVDPKQDALYELISKFQSSFKPEVVKERVLKFCTDISQDASGIDACTAQMVQHREEMCRAAPIIARSTCADLLQDIFSEEPSLEDPSQKNPGFIRKLINFWQHS